MFRTNRTLRFIAVFLALNILIESLAPYTAMALTGGPTQPEFASFEPVATTNMVDPFSGSFTYNLPMINVPGPNGSGYGISLSYHSGSGMEEEASWVGYGWTLNPGAINRNKSGFADDVNGGLVKYTNTVPKIYTASATQQVAFEGFGFDSKKTTSISASTTRTFNSYKGFGRTTTVGVGAFNGIASLDYTVGDDQSSFSLAVNPAAILSYYGKEPKEAASATAPANDATLDPGKPATEPAKKAERVRRDHDHSTAEGLAAGSKSYGIQSLNEIYRPTTVEQYKSFSIAIDVTLGGTPSPVPVSMELGISGNYVWQIPLKPNKYVYGSMYLAGGANNESAQMDYFVEKEAYYNKRDLFLGIPYNAADAYAVSGEGVGGGFRYKNDQVGHYFPTPLKSVTTLLNGSVEATAGDNIKPLTGLGLAVGVHTLRTNPGEGNGNYVSYTFGTPPSNGRESGYFRYNGDLSNVISYTNDDSYVRASVGMFPSKYTNLGSAISNEYKVTGGETQRAYRSSYIGYTSYRDFKDPQTVNNYYLKSYTRDVNTRNLVMKGIPSEASSMDDQVAEMYSVNQAGDAYVYGLPVLSYNEKSASIGLKVATNGRYNSMADTEGKLYNPLTNAAADTDAGYDISETHNYPYATTYLLTQIQTSDYIDRTFDGPTPDDLGGWTKFNYAPGQPASSGDYTTSSNWYSWRTPYTGYNYSRGTLSHTIDDLLNHSEGQKQQYFLETIETKTHIAYFVSNLTNITVQNENGDPVHIKGSQAARIDAASVNISSSAPAAASQTSRKLERIILFAKNDQSTATNIILSGKPLKIANLEYYGYSKDGTTAPTDISGALCKGIPNKLTNTTDNPFTQDGKLTLKRVWFEYEGVINAKISPYEFYYEYKNDWSLPAALQSKYSDITGYCAALTSANQNPDYNPMNADAWGTYRENGFAKLQNLDNRVDQVSSATFDPAAWQLKRIVMPSGGEMLVQYEQADYKYVHDQNATVMAALTSPTVPEEGSGSKAYYLDLAALGITSDDDITALTALITDYLKDHKLFFKFLYALNGSTTDITQCNVEYISGYAEGSVTKSGSQLSIQFVTPNGAKYTLPNQVCKDFYAKERKGLKLDPDCSINDRIPLPPASKDSREGVMPAMQTVISTPDQDNSGACKNINVAKSYIRIPALYAKKGGGIRVKRIMMYDPGLETGDQMLYGSEYIYKLADNKTSSGVATNEPMEMREENALVDFMKKRAMQNTLQKIISGVDKEQFEGPIGDGLLPGPSIGYSRVVVKNIHSGKTGTGFTVQEFYTAYDYPISKWGGDRSSILDGSRMFKYFPGIFVNTEIDRRYSSQGYAFVLYDIHGKPKRVATYKGDYNNNLPDQEKYAGKSYEETYEYTQPGEQVNVLDYNGVIRPLALGRDEEITMEMRSVSDITDDYSVKVDFDIGYYVIPLPFGTGMVNVGDDEKEMNTHVINKVVRYTPILKKTTLFKDGVTHITENKVFSISNGQPLVTVNYDGYDGLNLQQDHTHKGTVTNYSVPADFVYRDLSGKFKNEKLTYTLSSATITTVDATIGKYQLAIPQSNYDQGCCAVGDLIKLSNGSNQGYCYVTGLDKQSSGYLMTIQTLPNTNIDGALIGAAQNITVFVVHSGFENQLTADAASVSTYGDDPNAIQSPLIFTSGQNKLRGFSNVIGVSVQTYTGVRPYNSVMDASYNLSADYNDYLAGRAGKWRPFETYTQKKAITPSSATSTSRVYTGGTYSSDVFDFDPVATNTLWTKTNTVTMYSPDGNPLEEKNILNVYSSAKMGYGGNVPVLVAKNSSYSTSYFNGFEEYSKQNQMGVGGMAEFTVFSSVAQGIAHTGNQSLLIPPNGYVNYSEYSKAGVVDFALAVNDQLMNKGIMTRLWVKVNDAAYANGITNNLSITGVSTSGNVPFTLTEIARVGEWSLIEGVIPRGKVTTGGAFTIQMSNTSGLSMYVDDIRLQPYDGEMACYVYDPKNLRLLASFDDQHFALIYQYNAEGKLLRKLVETDKGVKTITESQFNTPQKTY